jgi:manganese/zinc/iron transport system substrate-binding protein
LSSCGQKAEQQKTDGKLNIVVTTGMIADMVKNIGGEQVTVTALMGPGVDPHLFKASQGDIGKLSRADAIFYNGLHLEGKMTDILQKMSRSKPVLPVAAGIEKAKLRQPPEFEGQYDPHIWFDVSLWIDAAQFVHDKLIEIDPTHRELYQTNGNGYISQLQKLHEWVKNQIVLIPENQRTLITAHDAFGYFGAAYGIKVMGLQGISTVAEYGVNDVTRLVDFIVEHKIPAIFVASSIPTRSIEAIIAGCQSRGANVKIGGTLYSDAIGESGGDADTYLKMIQHNVKTIVEALK